MSEPAICGYEPFLAEFYDLTQSYAERRDRDFYVGYSQSANGKTLELGCGTGRVLIPAARAGCAIVGLDISEHMLSKCREKLTFEPEEVQRRVRLVKGDMTDFNLNERFALITIPFRPFQHLIATADQIACLKRVRQHIAPDGKFILEVFQTNARRIHDEMYLKELEDVPESELPDGRKMRRTNRTVAFHRAEQYNDVEIIYYVTHVNGRAERLVQAFPFRYFFRYEVEHLLARCGFKVVELFGDFDKSPLTDDSPEMIFVVQARKQPESC